MRIIQHQNANSSKITVTNTATTLFGLIDTAGSLVDSEDYFTSPGANAEGVANAFQITPEDGDIRMGYGFTPTSTLGTLMSSGAKYYWPNIDLNKVRLIRVSGDVACSVEICKSHPTESPLSTAESVTVEGSISSSGLATSAKQDTQIAQFAKLVGLEIPAHDYVDLSYTGSNLTGVVFKTGGAGGTTVRTLSLTYDGSDNLDTVTAT